MNNTNYETDIVACVNQQAQWLRTKQFHLLDLKNLAYLLKWQYQPECQGFSWQRAIKEQRKAIEGHLKMCTQFKNENNRC